MTAEAAKRHSVRYFPSRANAAPPQGEAFLFVRDLHEGIMPIRGHTDRDFKVELSPAADDRAEWLTKFLSVGRYERNDLDEAVVDFVETATNHIAYFGEVIFEILRDGEGEPSAIDSLPHGRVLRTPWAYVQVIPKPDRGHFQERRYASIPKDDIWRLSLPRDLGSPRAHRRLLRRLGALGPSQPPFTFQTRDFGASLGYDFSAYLAACERLEEKTLRRWGGIPSKFRPVGTSTEYFFIARQLEFHRSQALVREHEIDELNKLLSRLDVANKVVVSGLPTAADISIVMDRMQKGEIGFSEALAAVCI